MNGWKLQPSPMKRKEVMIWTIHLHDEMFHVHLSGCNQYLSFGFPNFFSKQKKTLAFLWMQQIRAWRKPPAESSSVTWALQVAGTKLPYGWLKK